MIKKALIFLYICIIIVMATATFVEKYTDTTYTASYIYGAWWFILLWTMLTATGITYILKSKMRRWDLLLLHLSFLIILIGALLTHLTSYTGTIPLREGETTDKYFKRDTNKGMKQYELPFKIELRRFHIYYHEGTEAISDYASDIVITRGNTIRSGKVSMNNIMRFAGIRLYQSSYDDDKKGTVLSINSDPYGIPITYVGYSLLFFSLLYLLIDPKGTFRTLLKSPLLKKGILLILLTWGIGTPTFAVTTFPKETAHEFGKLYIDYNNRICPLQTFAIDFTKKLYGKPIYKEYSAEQVLLGFIFWGNEWSNEPIIKIKNGVFKETLQLPDYSSINAFFNMGAQGYRLAPYIEELYAGNQDAFHKQAGDLDDRIQLVLNVRKGTLLKVFPYTDSRNKHTIRWYAPTEVLPVSIDSIHRKYIKELFNILYSDALTGNYEHANSLIWGLRKFQVINGKKSLPTITQTKAERLYNSFPFVSFLFMANLCLGVLAILWLIYGITGKSRLSRRTNRIIDVLFTATFVLLFGVLSLLLALRWIITDNIPMSNGYETMLMIAWFVQLSVLLLRRQMRLLLVFGSLLSGFFMLVCHIGQMDPTITHLMPVLNSPLLSIHVSVIMMSYALLALTFVCGFTAISIAMFDKKNRKMLEALAVLSRIFLYPALVTLGLGIFIGAIWANISWGRYWSWDAKEVWALITFMIYAVPVHTQSLPRLQRPMAYHIYTTIAFLAILMTYFGVNYFLGGMHSYA